MTNARECLVGKIAGGKVKARAGASLLRLYDDFLEARGKELGDVVGPQAAAMDAAQLAEKRAAAMADDVRSNALAQNNVFMRALDYDHEIQSARETPGDFGFGNKAPPGLGKETQITMGAAFRSMLARDLWGIGDRLGTNVTALAAQMRGKAHAAFANAMEAMRPKLLGLKQEFALEMDFLRAVFGEPVEGVGKLSAQAWFKASDPLADLFIEKGGALTKREGFFPNPRADESKVRALGAERFKALVRDNVSREHMIDFETGKPMTDAKFEFLLDEATKSILAGGMEGLPSGQPQGRTALSSRRDMTRLFIWKNADAWMTMAEAVGQHTSPLEAALQHIDSITRDIAMMEMFGRNPDATREFMRQMILREPERLAVQASDLARGGERRAVRINRAIEDRAKSELKAFDNLWRQVSGEANVPVNVWLANTIGDARAWVAAANLGSALISSWSDVATVKMTSRMYGIPMGQLTARATSMMAEKGSEVFAAQMGVIADTMAHTAGVNDKILGEHIRMGVAGKFAAATIKASGLRRWSASWRAAFSLEMMAMTARDAAHTFDELAKVNPNYHATMQQFGITAGDWDVIRSTKPAEPRPGAPFILVEDVAAGGTPAHAVAAEKYARMRNSGMNMAVIESDPAARALLVGGAEKGTIGGEARHSIIQYRGFPVAMMMIHGGLALGKGWDGSRLGHGAATFALMSALGVVSMQAREIVQGRDPLSLDPTTGNGLRAWGKGILQGGGLGVFGDVMFVDQTRYGNSWAATLAGPVAGGIETVLGDFIFKNIQNAAKGEPTHFAGDALYAAARYLPGSSLWYGRLAFQRAVLDQLALQFDDRARQRFANMEKKARKDWGQSYWSQPGRIEPTRAPDLGTIMGAGR